MQGPLSYQLDENGAPAGLEHDLIEVFARELGVDVEFRVLPPAERGDPLGAGAAHLAAGWLSPPTDKKIRATQAIYLSRDTLIQTEASVPVEDLNDLRDKTIYVLPGSRQAQTLKETQAKVPGLKVLETDTADIFEVLKALDEGKISYLALDSLRSQVVLQHFPSLQVTLQFGPESPVVWWLGENPNEELVNRLEKFIDRVQEDGTLARIEDRYMGHVRRLTQGDAIKFLGKIETELPRFRKMFENAQEITGIDWRLLAAIAYHESNWDATATSRTNVRGIMMLTEDTADHLGVKNRLDPAESILAGARYLNMLKSYLPESVPEPDRTWLALSSYNIGPTNFQAGRTLATQLKADPDSWYEMKRVLPLLVQPRYYQALKIGRARGGEAVILVENIRSYYDILVRAKPAYKPKPKPVKAAKPKPGKQPAKPAVKPAAPKDKAAPALKAKGGLGLKPPKP